MKKHNQLFVLCLLSATLFSCSNDEQVNSPETNTSLFAKVEAGVAGNGHGNVLFKVKTRDGVSASSSRYVSNTYTHTYVAGTVNYSISSSAALVTITSPANDVLRLTGMASSSGNVTFTLTAISSSGATISTTSAYLDQATYNNLISPSDQPYAKATVIALTDLATYGLPSYCEQSLVSSAISCEASGHEYQLSLASGFFNNSCAGTCN